MIDQLRSLGIERGRAGPFAPDAQVRTVLDAAAREAHELLDSWYEQANKPFADGARWGVPVWPEYLTATADRFTDSQSYAVDARAVPFTFGYFSARHLGHGQFYLVATQDAGGEALDGGREYVLRVPADAPITQYWSVTLYDREIHALLRDVPRPGRSSQSPDLVVNPDGSTDIYLGPTAPAGHESNWAPTRPGSRFEILFRLYGPTPALFDKTWRLPDVQQVQKA